MHPGQLFFLFAHRTDGDNTPSRLFRDYDVAKAEATRIADKTGVQVDIHSTLSGLFSSVLPNVVSRIVAKVRTNWTAISSDEITRLADIAEAAQQWAQSYTGNPAVDGPSTENSIARAKLMRVVRTGCGA